MAVFPEAAGPLQISCHFSINHFHPLLEQTILCSDSKTQRVRILRLFSYIDVLLTGVSGLSPVIACRRCKSDDL